MSTLSVKGVGVVSAGPRSVRVRYRSVLVCVLLAIAVLGALIATLAAGVHSFPIPRVIAAVTGTGTPAENLIVGELRLPRAVTAVLVGIASGLAGALLLVPADLAHHARAHRGRLRPSLPDHHRPRVGDPPGHPEIHP